MHPIPKHSRNEIIEVSVTESCTRDLIEEDCEVLHSWTTVSTRFCLGFTPPWTAPLHSRWVLRWSWLPTERLVTTTALRGVRILSHASNTGMAIKAWISTEMSQLILAASEWLPVRFALTFTQSCLDCCLYTLNYGGWGAQHDLW